MDQLMITTLALILITVLSMQFILFSVPIFQRMTFDALCHQTLMQMDHDGGLTAASYSRLETDLLSRGFDNPIIHGSSNVAFGDEISLYVSAEITTSAFVSPAEQAMTKRQLLYENTVISRHLITLAGEA